MLSSQKVTEGEAQELMITSEIPSLSPGVDNFLSPEPVFWESFNDDKMFVFSFKIIEIFFLHIPGFIPIKIRPSVNRYVMTAHLSPKTIFRGLH
jgi:hypothetical protein